MRSIIVTRPRWRRHGRCSPHCERGARPQGIARAAGIAGVTWGRSEAGTGRSSYCLNELRHLFGFLGGIPAVRQADWAAVDQTGPAAAEQREE